MISSVTIFRQHTFQLTSKSKEYLIDSDNPPQPIFVGLNLWQYVGDGIDNDGDGRTDEEWLDGINNDGDLDANGYSKVDERDYGYVPRDLLYFASSQDNLGMSDIMEIAYTVQKPQSASDRRRLIQQWTGMICTNEILFHI